MPCSQHLSGGLSFSRSYTATQLMPGSLSTPQHRQPRQSRHTKSSNAPSPGTAGSQARRAGHLQGDTEQHHERLLVSRQYPEEPSPRQVPSERPGRTTRNRNTRGGPPAARHGPALAAPRLPRELPAAAGPRASATSESRLREPPPRRPSSWLPRETPTERTRPRAGYSPSPSRPRSQKVSLPGPHRSLPLRRGERQSRRPMAPRKRAAATNARRREAGPRGPPARRSGGSASRRAGTAPSLAPRASRPGPAAPRSPGACLGLRLRPGRASPPLPAGFSAAGAGPQSRGRRLAGLLAAGSGTRCGPDLLSAPRRSCRARKHPGIPEDGGGAAAGLRLAPPPPCRPWPWGARRRLRRSFRRLRAGRAALRCRRSCGAALPGPAVMSSRGL